MGQIKIKLAAKVLLYALRIDYVDKNEAQCKMSTEKNLIYKGIGLRTKLHYKPMIFIVFC